MTIADKTADILERLERVESALAGLGHNGGPPLDLDESSAEDRRLSAVQVARRYGVVVRTIDRWCDRPKLNFPHPETVNLRRYWWLSTLRRWDRARLRQSIVAEEKSRSGPTPKDRPAQKIKASRAGKRDTQETPDAPVNNLLPTPQQELDELAGVIRIEHQAVGLAAGNMLEHALRAGDALQAAQKQVAKGAWENWVRKNCDLSLRCAQVYMQLAAARPQIEAQAQHAAPHSLRAALKLIGSTSSKTPSRSRNTASKTKSATATSFDALGWWSTAPLEQRRHLLDGAGCTSVREALPSAWRDSTGIASKPSSTAVTVADAGEGIGRDDIASDSSGENERLRVRVEELEHEKRRLEIEADGLRSELEKTKAEIEQARAAQTLDPSEHLSAEQLIESLEGKLKRTPKTHRAFKDLRKELPRPPQLELTADSTPDKPTLPVTTSDGKAIRDEIFRNYRKLPLEDLVDLIHAIRSAAGRGVHVRQAQWDAVERMRAWADELKRAVLASVQAQGSTTGATKH